MFSHPSLPRAGVVYVTTVVAIGSAVVFLSIYRLTELATNHDFRQWYLLAALALLSGSVTVKLPSVPATISISETFVFTSVIMYGPSAGAVIVALDGFVMSIWLSKQRRELHRVVFNMAGPALSIWLSGQVYYLLPGVSPLPASSDLVAAIPSLIAPIAAFTLTHFILNSTFIALAVSFETKRPFFTLWRTDFLWLSLNYFGAASVTLMLLVSTGLNATYFSIIIPLLLILYFTFKIPMARVEDANRHIDEVNALYVSTIETLAMAVDAKDQVTHGHIRRVQTYAVGLAKALGVSDPGLLKAIEASALLHDMGKLAIPEHILNKPGKLTPAEFDKIKMHASLGADLLSAIAFPYPVVPIVRHHHENWDGTGYPTGITGTDIPIGARILSVVDCYDALTSDRPYRPQLTDEAATSILLQRRGSMYDPLVVDTFVRVHRSIAAPEALSGPQSDTYANIARLSAPESKDPRTLVPRRSSLDRALAELVSLSLESHLNDGDSTRANILLRVILAATGAPAGLLAKYADSTDDLVILTSEGLEPRPNGRRMSVGDHLTGWVAANCEPILNSDAALDLRPLLLARSVNLTMCLSVPLLTQDNDLIGVVSVYSPDQFTADHFDTVRSLAVEIARVLRISVGDPATEHRRLEQPALISAKASR